MIEKLDTKMECVELSVFGKQADCLDFEAARKLNLKINELVDAVNVLQAQVAILEEHAHPTAKVYEEAQNMYDNAILDALKDKEVDVVVEPADPYAEQRKWIGCLCRFWFDNKKQADIGILGDIDKDEIHPYFNADLGHNYKCCEPVKPDDDIIYKGGDNDDR